MTGYSNNFSYESDPRLIDRFEDMLASGNSFFFDVEELELLADHYLELGIYPKARKVISHGLELHPQSSALLLKKAQVLLLSKKPEKALKILDFLEATEPTNTEMLLFKAVVHRNLSDHEGTKSCLMKALKTTPENREDIFLDLAFEQEMVEDYDGAIQSLIQSLEINPNHEASLFELGYCFDMAEDLEQGVTYFQEYLDKTPYSFVGWYNLALCYEKLGLFEKAIEAVDYCIAIKEDFTNAHILRGNMYTSCDLDFLAIQAYTDSLEFDSKNPMVFTAIGECYERLGTLDLAEHNYQNALSIDAMYVDALMGLGAVREEQGLETESFSLYREALKHDELNLDNWHVYADSLMKAEHVFEAEAAYERMTILFEEDEEAWTSLSEVKATIYGHAEALRVLERADESIPSAIDIPLHKAKHLILSGKAVQGEEILADALHQNPTGGKYFLSIFPESIQFPNIAALIELYTQAQREDEF